MTVLLKFLFGGGRFKGFVPDLGLLLGRLGFGLLLAFQHGMSKVPPSEGVVGMVDALGFPAPLMFAWAAGLAEFIGALLVAIGFLTRPAALAIVFTMCVAAFMQHAADPIATKEMALLYLSFGLIYMFSGAGKFSVDHLINRTHPE